MRHRVDDHSVALQLIHDAMRKLLQGTAPDRVLARLVVVRPLSECSQRFCHSALKLVGEPLVALEQIEVRLARVVYGRTSISNDLTSGHGAQDLANIWARASSIGTVLALPAFHSARRRRVSSSHASSTPASGTSGTISSRRSASVARSSSLSFIASAKMRSTFGHDDDYTTASGRVPIVGKR